MLYAQRQVQPPPLMPAPCSLKRPRQLPQSRRRLRPKPSQRRRRSSPKTFRRRRSQRAPRPTRRRRCPQPAPGFEERLGTRWVVWIGGLDARARRLLHGALFDRGRPASAPACACSSAALFALALLGAGEWSRRKESISNIAALPIANIPAILTAAGTAVAFATVYAAYALYGFLVPATAFVLLGLVALGTLAAALLHGPALAGLGVVGAFVTPILVSSGKPDYWALYIYLAIVTAASFGLARIRLWRWLAVTTIAFAVLWIFPGLDTGDLQVAPHAFHVIAGFVLAALLVVCGFMFGPTIEDGEIEPVSSGSLGAYLFGAMLIVLSSAHADLALIAFTLLVGGDAVRRLARAGGHRRARRGRRDRLHRVRRMGGARQSGHAGAAGRPACPASAPTATDSAVTLHLVMAAIFAAGFGIAGFLAQGRSNSAIIPVVWSAAAVSRRRSRSWSRSTPASPISTARSRSRSSRCCSPPPLALRPKRLRAAKTGRALRSPTALFATGTLGALALALTFALEKGWLTIALALMSLGTAWISLQRPIPFLRWLAAIFAGIVTARIGYDPRIVGDAVGTTPIFNWLLWGYGLPAASFWAASMFLRRRGDDAPLRMVEARRDPVHRAARLHGDPPFCQPAATLTRSAVAARIRAAGLRRARHGDRAGAPAAAQPQHRAQCRRGRAHGDRRARQRVRPAAPGEPAALAHRCRRRRRSTCCCSATRCRRC